jgi:hypothetical protein
VPGTVIPIVFSSGFGVEKNCPLRSLAIWYRRREVCYTISRFIIYTQEKQDQHPLPDPCRAPFSVTSIWVKAVGSFLLFHAVVPGRKHQQSFYYIPDTLQGRVGKEIGI